MTRRVRLIVLSAALMLWLTACSLAGDITPPPGAGSAAPHPTLAPTTNAPEQPTAVVVSAIVPSAAEGGLIFAEHCAACHGPTGQGDGERSAQLMTQRTEPLPNFSEPTLARQRTPAQWLQVVTEGRLDKLMPPWAQSLSENQRRQVVAFLYTLSTPPTQIEAGQKVYVAQCAACHGDSGETVTQASFADVVMMTERSPQQLFDALQNSAITEHSFAALSETERWAVTAYLQTFSYEYAAPGAPLPEKIGTIVGSVVNGTGGASVPAGIEINAHGFETTADGFNVIATLTTTTDAAGQFKFENVPYKAGRKFLTTTSYQAVTYGSTVSVFENGATLALPLQIFDTTPDTTALRVEQLHVILEFLGDHVRVGQLYLLSNLGDKTITSPTLEFDLPAGATEAAVQGETEGEGYTRTANGLALKTPIYPGQSDTQFLFSFRLPYPGQLAFTQPMRYPIAEVNLLLSEPQLTVNGAGWVARGLQNIQGSQFQGFSRQSLAAGEALTFEVAGGSAANSFFTVGSAPELALGLGTLALVAVGIGAWWARRPRSAPAETPSKNDLLTTIAKLDDDFALGQLAERDYQQRRQVLKEQLLRVW